MSDDQRNLSALRLHEAVAMALVSYDRERIADAIPQEVWDDLHDRGLVRTERNIVDEADTFLTLGGSSYLLGVLSEKP